MKKTTLNDFLIEAKEVHGDIYDYTNTTYTAIRNPITITCPKHGEFTASSAKAFLRGAGCKQCKKLENNAKDSFIKRAKEKHSDKFDYSLVEYIGRYVKVKIKCPEHGIFEQTPDAHLHCKHSCSGCVLKINKAQTKVCKTKTVYAFVEEAKKVHGDKKYDYSKTMYINKKSPVTITCKIHGDFTLSNASSHVRNSAGCKQCSVSKARWTNEMFIAKVNEVHENKYIYTKTIYTTAKNKVIITCPKHGDFEQTAGRHVIGAGCQKCGEERGHGWSRSNYVSVAKEYNKGKAYLYVVRAYDENEEFYKIGITINKIYHRLKKNKFPYKYETIQYIEGDAEGIWNLERQLQKLYKEWSYTPLKEFGGRTECYKIPMAQQIEFS